MVSLRVKSLGIIEYGQDLVDWLKRKDVIFGTSMFNHKLCILLALVKGLIDMNYV
jgi:hypothetical protein